MSIHWPVGDVYMGSQFNNLIQSKSIASITPQQILDAGKPVFFDVMTSADIASINRLVQAYSRIHAPTYGQPIPLSGKITAGDGNGAIYTPNSTEIARIVSIKVTNGGGAPMTANLTIGGQTYEQISIDPTNPAFSLTARDLLIDKNLPIGITATSGSPADLTTSVISILVVQ